MSRFYTKLLETRVSQFTSYRHVSHKTHSVLPAWPLLTGAWSVFTYTCVCITTHTLHTCMHVCRS